jgi:hypothetical protein
MNHTPENHFSGGHTTAASIGIAPSVPLSPVPDVTTGGPSETIAPTEVNAGRGETFPAPDDTDTQPQRPLSGPVASSPVRDSLSPNGPSITDPLLQATAGWNPAAMGTDMLPEENSGTVEETATERPVVDLPHETPPPPALLTEKALEKGAWRVRLLKAARPLLRGPHAASQEAVAQLLGTSGPTLCRLLQDYQRIPDDQLTPERCAVEIPGRPSPYAYLADIPAVVQRLQQLYLLTCGASSDYMSKDRRTGSAALALERFADDPLCPASLADKLRAGKFPKPLVQLIRRLTPEMEQRARGSKHASLNGTLIQRRTTLEILANGDQQKIQLGDWWVFDDMSDNQPFWFLGPDGAPLVGRQGLYAYDIRRHWLGAELIGTARDSYTAAIILRFMRRLMQALGKPRRGVVLEQSVWKARVISGTRLTATGELFEEEIERPALPEADKNLVHDGLRALGIEVFYTHTPRGKEIEGAFNYLQRVAPTFSPEAINIGRHAGEFEAGAKNLRRAHAGSHHPRDLGFLEMDARADVLERTMAWINARESQKTTHGDYPVLLPISGRDLPVFLPRRHDLELRGGKLTASVDGEPYDFCAPELFASLGAGYRLTLKFDPAEPTLGAAIYNRETSSANHQGWPVGQYIGQADFLPPVARFDWRSGDVPDPAADAKRRFNKYVRTAFRAVGMKQFRASTARDGRGNVAEITGETAAHLSASRPASLVAAARPIVNLAPETQARFTKQSDRLARQAAHARSLRELTDA